jgi:hypothetical protein
LIWFGLVWFVSFLSFLSSYSVDHFSSFVDSV